MKLFGGPIAHKVIEGYIEQNICFTRIEKEVNEQLFGDLPIVISITQGFTSIPKAKS